MKLVLASSSPRRARILRDLGLSFEVLRTSAEEVSHPAEPERTVRENALAKWRAGKAELDALGASGAGDEPVHILAADTIVWYGSRIYGKPRDLDEAREFLRTLSGQTHLVFTGVVLDGEAKVVQSAVRFRELSDAAIEEYIQRVKPLDRAGAYDIDESGDLIVAGYEGSYENIMGLPVEPLREWGLC